MGRKNRGGHFQGNGERHLTVPFVLQYLQYRAVPLTVAPYLRVGLPSLTHTWPPGVKKILYTSPPGVKKILYTSPPGVRKIPPSLAFGLYGIEASSTLPPQYRAVPLTVAPYLRVGLYGIEASAHLPPQYRAVPLTVAPYLRVVKPLCFV